MAIGINTPLSEFIAAAEGQGACAEALEWLRSLGNITVRQMVEASADVPESQNWAGWVRGRLDLTNPAKILLSERAVRGRPGLAAHYDIHVADTPSEGAVLEKLWSPDDLPETAEELRAGLVRRKRERR